MSDLPQLKWVFLLVLIFPLTKGSPITRRTYEVQFVTKPKNLTVTILKRNHLLLQKEISNRDKVEVEPGSYKFIFEKEGYGKNIIEREVNSSTVLSVELEEKEFPISLIKIETSLVIFLFTITVLYFFKIL